MGKCKASKFILKRYLFRVYSEFIQNLLNLPTLEAKHVNY